MQSNKLFMCPTILVFANFPVFHLYFAHPLPSLSVSVSFLFILSISHWIDVEVLKICIACTIWTWWASLFDEQQKYVKLFLVLKNLQNLCIQYTLQNFYVNRKAKQERNTKFHGSFRCLTRLLDVLFVSLSCVCSPNILP